MVTNHKKRDTKEDDTKEGRTTCDLLKIALSKDNVMLIQQPQALARVLQPRSRCPALQQQPSWTGKCDGALR